MSELISHRHLRVLAALAWLSGGAGILIGVVDDTIDNVILRPVVAQVLQESTGAACR